MRVMLVDDNRDIAELLYRILAIEGYQVCVARDGREALQRDSIEQPHMVICDVNLPGINGWEVCRKLKTRRDVPVMMLTVRAEESDIRNSHAAGADDHLAKPFDVLDFMQRVRTLALRPEALLNRPL